MTPTEAAWLAGFLDGEGSFMVTRSFRKTCAAPTYIAVVAAANTDIRLVERCKTLAGGCIVGIKSKSDRWKDAYHWTLKGVGVGPVLVEIIPYLVSKKRQAELLLHLRSLTRIGSPPGRNSTRKTLEEVDQRTSVYIAVRDLNKRGPRNPTYAAMSERRINGDRGALLDLMEAAQ